MKKLIVGLLSIIGATSVTVAATAGERPWYVAPGIAFIWTDSDRAADDDLGLQLGLGRILDERWNLEASLLYDKLDRSSGGNSFDQKGLLLDALYLFDRDHIADPYLVFGVGGLKTRFAGRDNTNLAANLGVGLMHRINERVGLRADVRYRYDADDNSLPSQSAFGDWVLNLGLTIPFGGRSTVPVEVATASVPVDSDGDGVADDRDACPGTASGASVDVRGCEVDSDRDGVVDRLDRCAGTPGGVRVDAQGCEPDADADGVVDRVDRCPLTPRDAVVDEQGCEVDSDHDGVANSADRCPATPAGGRVDIHGCVIQDVIVLEGVHFATASAELVGDSRRILDDVARTLKAHPELRVEVAGYTDDRGSRRYNRRLSQRRAEAVRRYLISRGVDAGRLTARGYGPEDPIASNATEAGRAKNRRVELHIAE